MKIFKQFGKYIKEIFNKKYILFAILFSIFCSSTIIAFSFATTNYGYLFASIPNTIGEQLFLEIYAENKTANSDYWYLDYQFSNEKIEEFQDTFSDEFIFKNYGENYVLDTNGDVVSSYSSTVLFKGTNDETTVNAITATSLNRRNIKKLLKDKFGIELLYSDISNVTVPNSVILSYELAEQYCIINGIELENINSLIGKTIDFGCDRQYIFVSCVIVGVVSRLEELPNNKIPKSFGNDFCFISELTYFNSSPSIFVKVPNSTSQLEEIINYVNDHFSLQSNTINNNDFAIKLRYRNLIDNSFFQIHLVNEYYDLANNYVFMKISSLFIILSIFILLILFKNPKRTIKLIASAKWQYFLFFILPFSYLLSFLIYYFIGMIFKTIIGCYYLFGQLTCTIGIIILLAQLVSFCLFKFIMRPHHE